MRRAGKGTRPRKGEISGQPQPQRDPAEGSGAEMTSGAWSYLKDKELGFGTSTQSVTGFSGLGWGLQFPNAIP